MQQTGTPIAFYGDGSHVSLQIEEKLRELGGEFVTATSDGNEPNVPRIRIGTRIICGAPEIWLYFLNRRSDKGPKAG